MYNMLIIWLVGSAGNHKAVEGYASLQSVELLQDTAETPTTSTRTVDRYKISVQNFSWLYNLFWF
jgi:hypothetical protein